MLKAFQLLPDTTGPQGTVCSWKNPLGEQGMSAPFGLQLELLRESPGELGKMYTLICVAWRAKSACPISFHVSP